MSDQFAALTKDALHHLLSLNRGGAFHNTSAPSGEHETKAQLPQPGMLIKDTWRLVKPLGHGNFGMVFEAEHKELSKRVALKFLHPHWVNDARLRERFLQEAKVMANLEGEHIVDVHDYGQLTDGTPYFVMELLEGQSLAACLQRTPKLPLSQFYAIARGLLESVAEVHSRGIIHRDIKPANIFINKRDGKIDFVAGSVKLLDFGLAKTSLRLTQTKELLGTPLYTAPELLGGGDRNPDQYSDIYAVAVVIYEMLTGRLPILPPEGGSDNEFARRIQTEIPPKAHDFRPDVPEALSQFLARALSKQPETRPSTPQEFWRELEVTKPVLSFSDSLCDHIQTNPVDRSDYETLTASREGSSAVERARHAISDGVTAAIHASLCPTRGDRLGWTPLDTVMTCASPKVEHEDQFDLLKLIAFLVMGSLNILIACLPVLLTLIYNHLWAAVFFFSIWGTSVSSLVMGWTILSLRASTKASFFGGLFGSFGVSTAMIIYAPIAESSEEFAYSMSYLAIGLVMGGVLGSLTWDTIATTRIAYGRPMSTPRSHAQLVSFPGVAIIWLFCFYASGIFGHNYLLKTIQLDKCLQLSCILRLLMSL